MLLEVKIWAFHKSGLQLWIHIQLSSHFFLATRGILGYNICNNGSLLTTFPHICLRAPLIWTILSLYVMTRAGVTPPIGDLVVLTLSVVKVVSHFSF